MVNATSNPRLWRCEFEVQISDTAKSTVVCYLYLIEAGLRIYYSHHVLYSRPVAKGAWTGQNTVRQTLDPMLKAMIQSAAFREVWSMAQTEEVMMFPAEPGTKIHDVDLGL